MNVLKPLGFPLHKLTGHNPHTRVRPRPIYPDLGLDGQQQLALQQYLANLVKPQVLFGVKRKRPKTADEAVAATLEIESYLVLAMGVGKVNQVSQADPDPQGSVINVVKTQQDAMLEMMSQLVQRMDQLESAGEPNKGHGPGQQGIHRRGSTTPRS